MATRRRSVKTTTKKKKSSVISKDDERDESSATRSRSAAAGKRGKRKSSPKGEVGSNSKGRAKTEKKLGSKQERETSDLPLVEEVVEHTEYVTKEDLAVLVSEVAPESEVFDEQAPDSGRLESPEDRVEYAHVPQVESGVVRRTEGKQDESVRSKLFTDNAQAIDALFQHSLQVKGARVFNELLDFIGRFSRISIYNTMLVHVQRPSATVVGTRNQWAEIGRTVDSQATPIIILMPFGPVQFVYELEDTHGAPVSEDVQDPLRALGNVSRSTWRRSVATAKKSGVKVELVQPNSLHATSAPAWNQGTHGETQQISEEDYRWRVRVNRLLDKDPTFETLALELAHVYCGHQGSGPKDRWPDRSTRLSQHEKELEAQAAAYVVCVRSGISNQCGQYLAAYVTEPELKGISPYAILCAANRIEAR